MNLSILGYIGPETFLPLASVIAAVLGFLIAVGRRPIHYARKIARYLFPKDEE